MLYDRTWNTGHDVIKLEIMTSCRNNLFGSAYFCNFLSDFMIRFCIVLLIHKKKKRTVSKVYTYERKWGILRCTSLILHSLYFSFYTKHEGPKRTRMVIAYPVCLSSRKTDYIVCVLSVGARHNSDLFFIV